MTSLLSPMRLGVFDLPEIAAHFPSNIPWKVQANDDHRLPLPVSIGRESSKPYSYNPIFLRQFRNEVGEWIGCAFIENENWVLRGSCLADDGHQTSPWRLQ